MYAYKAQAVFKGINVAEKLNEVFGLFSEGENQFRLTSKLKM